MRNRVRVMAVLVILGSIATARVDAQLPLIRDGFYSTIGIGFGGGKISCSSCTGGRASGVSGLFAVGTAIDQPLIIGAELDFFYRPEANFEDAAIGTVTAFAQWYPASTGPFFAKGGLGLGFARVTVQNTSGGFDSKTSTGFGYMLAAGYDIRIGNAVSLTPLVGFYGGSLGDVDQVTGVSANVFQVILTVGFF